MTPKEIQNKLNEAVMNIQSLQAELDKLKSNLSEKPNSCDHLLVAVHEAVTTEPNPYAVDWSNAPEWADVHCYNSNGEGHWYGAIISEYYKKWLSNNMDSGHTLPTGLDWKQSKTIRPK